MRTTVTLDPDVAERLKALALERGVSFKSALNSAVRSGLDRGARSGDAFVVKARSMRARPGVDLDHALRLSDELEDAEVLRKMELGK
jgi:Ribbon-helix-helix protein, copG family